MWRLSEQEGAMVVLFGVLMTMLLGATAMVVDTGRLFGERSQRQNAADAAALAVAIECAERADAAEPCHDPNGTATTYLNHNYSGLQGTVVSGTVGDSGAVVGVVVDDTHVQLTGLHMESALVGASAYAEWSVAVSGVTRPFAVHSCAFDSGRNEEVILRVRLPAGIRDEPSCDGISGDAAWLSDSEECKLTSRLQPVADTVVQAGGIEDCLDEGRTQPVIVFEACPGCGDMGAESYVVIGYAFLDVRDSEFGCPSLANDGGDVTVPPASPPLDGSDPNPAAPAVQCVRGSFVNGILPIHGAWTSEGSAPTDFGARAVRLID